MPGFQEIFILLLIAFLIFFLPRFFRNRSENRSVNKISFSIHWRTRLYIVVSVAWVFGTALYFKIWEMNFIPFAEFGILPVLALWGTVWVLSGLKNKTEK